MSRIGTSSTGGNVNIQDTNGNPLNSSGGALDVNVVSSGSSGTPISIYNEITSVAMGATATVLTYTVPTGNTLNLTRINCSGDSIGTITVNFNSIVNAKSRLYYTNFNVFFEYNNQQNGFLLSSGTVVTIIATNNSLQGAGSFNATLLGVLNS